MPVVSFGVTVNIAPGDNARIVLRTGILAVHLSGLTKRKVVVCITGLSGSALSICVVTADTRALVEYLVLDTSTNKTSFYCDDGLITDHHEIAVMKTDQRSVDGQFRMLVRGTGADGSPVEEVSQLFTLNVRPFWTRAAHKAMRVPLFTLKGSFGNGSSPMNACRSPPAVMAGSSASPPSPPFEVKAFPWPKSAPASPGPDALRDAINSATAATDAASFIGVQEHSQDSQDQVPSVPPPALSQQPTARRTPATTPCRRAQHAATKRARQPMRSSRPSHPTLSLSLRTQSRVREHGGALLATGSCPAEPATPTGAVAMWPEEPGLTPECTRYILKLRQARTKLAKLEGSDPTPCFSRLKSWDRLPDAQAHSGDGHTQRTSALTRHSAGCSPE